MVTLQSVGYSPGGLNPPYTGNSVEWWLLFIIKSVILYNINKDFPLLFVNPLYSMAHTKCCDLVLPLSEPNNNSDT